MRAVRLLVAKDVRSQFRNRSVLVLGFVAPLVLAFVLDLVFGGTIEPDSDDPVTFDVGLADLDGGDAAADFAGVLDELASIGLLDVTRYDDEGAVRAAVDDGDIDAAWVLGEGFSDTIASGAEAEIVVVGDVDSPIAVSVAESIADRFATGVGAATLAALVAVDTGVAGADEVAAIAEAAAQEPPLAELEPVGDDDGGLDVTTQLTAGLALFFVFFAGGLPLLSIIDERARGTLARLLVAPIPPSSIIAGKALAAVVIGSLSLVSLMVASTVLMGADWGPPVGAVALAVAAVLAAVGILSVAGTTARTTEQAGNLQGIVAVVLAIAGGAFVPVSREASVLGRLRSLTPHGWYVDGLDALRDDGLGAALPAVAVLLAMAAVTGAVGLRMAAGSLRR